MMIASSSMASARGPGRATRCERLAPCLQPARLGSTSRLTAHASDNDKNERVPWDTGRFLQTVAFFNNPLQIVPKVAEGVAKAITAPLRAPEPTNEQDEGYITLLGSPAKPNVPAVLVTGATGGVGSRVVARLLAKGKRVRALVRDNSKARSMLGKLPVAPGGVLEVATADLSQPDTLRGELFTGVRAVVSCAGCVARTKDAENDADAEAKYQQGIKFYKPELVRDTPDAVEMEGVATILARVSQQLGTTQGVNLLDASRFDEQWGPLDDVVMGGASQSGIYRVPRGGPAGQDIAVFRGIVSVANNGGFASVRPRNWDPPLDLGGYEGLRVTLKGDGQRYKFILRCSDAWDSISYNLSVDTPKGEWATLDLPFSDFRPVFRARTDTSAAPLDPAAVHSLQIMLSKFEYDGELNPRFSPGRFELPVSDVTAYTARGAAPRWVHVSSAGVTRINRPGINVEEEPPAVRMNDMLGGLLTYKLAAEDALRKSGVSYAIVRPCALTVEPAGMPMEFDQGDTIRGKIGRDDLASLCVHLLQSSAATNTTFEVKSTVPFSEPWGEEQSAAAAPRDWEGLLTTAALQEGVTGKTIDGVYTGKEAEEEALKKPQAQKAKV